MAGRFLRKIKFEMGYLPIESMRKPSIFCSYAKTASNIAVIAGENGVRFINILYNANLVMLFVLEFGLFLYIGFTESFASHRMRVSSERGKKPGTRFHIEWNRVPGFYRKKETNMNKP